MAAENWSVAEPRTIDVDGVTALRAAIIGGRLDIVSHEQPTTRIEVTEVSGLPLDVSFDGSKLEIKPSQLSWDKFSWEGLKGIFAKGGKDDRAVVSILIPAGIPVSAATVAGEGLVSGAGGKVTVSTVTGSMMADATAGKLTANTVSGEVIVRDHDGTLVGNSVSGELTASGTLDHVRMNTVGGDVSLDLIGQPSDLAVNTVSGDVLVRVPAGTGVTLNANTATGTILVNDEKFPGAGRSVHRQVGPAERSLKFNANTVSGNVSVFQPAGAQH